MENAEGKRKNALGKREMHLGRGKCRKEEGKCGRQEAGVTEHTEMPSLKSGHHHASNE